MVYALGLAVLYPAGNMGTRSIPICRPETQTNYVLLESFLLHRGKHRSIIFCNPAILRASSTAHGSSRGHSFLPDARTHEQGGVTWPPTA